MGTWGAGNFESDEALDFLWLAVQQPLHRRIAAASAGKETPGLPVTDVMAAAGIILALIDRCGAAPPEPHEVREWRDNYLKQWECEVHEQGGAPDFIEQRRIVIRDTFDTLLERAETFYR